MVLCSLALPLKIKEMMLTFVFVFLSSQAAPLPGMGSSILSAKKQGIPFHVRGYDFNLEASAWDFKKVTLQQQKDQFQLEVPGQNEARVEVSQLNHNMSFKTFTQKWNKDYYHFGFEILGKKDLLLQGKRTVLVDLFHRKDKKYFRQMIMSAGSENMKQERVMIVTCSYSPDDSATIKNCNEIGSQFSWLSQKDDQKTSLPSEPQKDSEPLPE